jgi:serine/threonine-protein kinase
MNCPRCGLASDRLDACPSCLLASDEPALLGGTIELEEEIGRGGMGTVYKAKHVRLGRTVAVKFLPNDMANQKEFEARFEREARALAMLNHPNIVAVHDFGRDDGVSYIVMEYVDGKPLTEHIPLSVSRATEVAIQICDALQCAHRLGIVHRDIKPENILIDGSGRVKVTDFGIARMDERGWTITTKNEAIGTPHYMSPEALKGAAPDPRMDVYSLGVVLYQLVTGRLPTGNFAPPPPPLDRIIMKAMSAEPSQRFASAEEMRRALAGSGVQTGIDLNADEKTWVKAVAMLQSISTAVALWAFLQSVRPKIHEKGFDPLLIAVGQKILEDGRVLTMARFEMWPTIAALATFAVAITAYGFLRRHWRLAGLEQVTPEIPVAESKVVFFFGIASLSVYGLRKILESQGVTSATPYFTVFGAAILIGALFYLWVSILLCWRTSRPFYREYLMWGGFWLAVLPPIIEFFIYVSNWRAQ